LTLIIVFSWNYFFFQKYKMADLIKMVEILAKVFKSCKKKSLLKKADLWMAEMSSFFSKKDIKTLSSEKIQNGELIQNVRFFFQ
jgi:hypothetical protein